MRLRELLSEFLFGPVEVAMPPHATSEALERGVNFVGAAIAEERRREEEKKRREEEAIRAGSRPSDAMYQSNNIVVVCSGEGHRRRPPNLHAENLSFSARLVLLVRERCGGKSPIAYKRAGIDRKLYSKIVSNVLLR